MHVYMCIYVYVYVYIEYIYMHLCAVLHSTRVLYSYEHISFQLISNMQLNIYEYSYFTQFTSELYKYPFCRVVTNIRIYFCPKILGQK